MLCLTSLGLFHTAISLIALATGIIALVRDQEITWNNLVGKIYVITTVITCLTGFGIFEHGGFGKPHALGIITLLVLVLAFIAGSKSNPFGKASPYIKTVSYSATFFFHIVPAITETATRLPSDAPLASGPDDPNIQMVIGICLVLFIIGATLQVMKLRKKAKLEVK
jgi:uncharacterized membrane protein